MDVNLVRKVQNVYKHLKKKIKPSPFFSFLVFFFVIFFNSSSPPSKAKRHVVKATARDAGANSFSN